MAGESSHVEEARDAIFGDNKSRINPLDPLAIIDASIGESNLVDPVGLTAFVDAHKRMQRIAGELVFSGPSPDLIHAFRSADLDKVFTVTPAWSHPAYGYGRTNAGDRAGWGRSG